MNIWEWESTVYPKMWREAYDLGERARNDGCPRECNLPNEFLHNGRALKTWKSAWGQGWDNTVCPPPIFKQMEDVLDQMPTHPCRPDGGRDGSGMTM